MCEQHGHISTAGATAVDLRTIGGGRECASKAPSGGSLIQRLHAKLFPEKKSEGSGLVEAPVPARIEAPLSAKTPEVVRGCDIESILKDTRSRLDSLSRGGGHSKKIARAKALEAGLAELANVLKIDTSAEKNVLAARFKIAERVGELLTSEGALFAPEVASYVKMLKGLN